MRHVGLQTSVYAIVRMVVILFLASGEQRVIEADGAHMDGPFFMVTRWDARLQRGQTVVTLRSQDVIRAEIRRDGETVEVVLGAAVTPKP